MTDYTKKTDFKAKDGLPSGSPDKIIKGIEFDDEFNLISVANNSKANINSPTFTGTVVLPDVNIVGDVEMTLGTSDLVTIHGGTY